MWTDLKGWDSASKENEARVTKFSSADFTRGELTLPYRYYEAESVEEGAALPLVVFLHGADVIGTDNVQQLSAHDIGTVFADEAWQAKHPCHILAPQYPRGMHWRQPVVCDWLEALIRLWGGKGADPARIYLYGYSAGAIGIFALIRRRPHFYAAAMPICGSAEDKDLELLADTPLWLFHAEDDTIVRSGESVWVQRGVTNLGSHVLAERLRPIMRAELHYTEYPLGQMQEKYHLHTHCSWVPAGRDRKAHEWLFEQRRLQP
ncbi:MAG: hypothetical protein IK115_13540 [Lachnospiraceae bacterium]|nr:hypothetical protein [Lachnospiraceae bacterium]